MNNSINISVINNAQVCERCDEGKIKALVTSPLLSMQVCVQCALVAIELTGPVGRLKVQPIVWM